MNEHDAMEQSYKNGYEAGVKDLISAILKKCEKKTINLYEQISVFQIEENELRNILYKMGVDIK